jgi:hypothetical protein
MRRFIVFLIIALFLIPAPIVFADEQVTLAWDPNSPDPDGYRLFRRVEGQAYDYAAPISGDVLAPTVTYTDTVPAPATPTPPAATDLTASYNRDQSVITLSWQQIETTASETFYWVVRAFVGSDESGDSNEVNHTVTASSAVSRWDVFYALAPEGPWVPIDSIENTGQTNPTMDATFTAVEVGNIAEVYFTVVSFDAAGQFSANAQSAATTVDRRTPVAPALRIEATLIVE